MKIGIVNDLPIALETLKRVVSSVPEYKICWTALNGEEAVKKTAIDKPDLILMDLIMPVMDGVHATSEIMKKTPCAILIVTASVGGNSGRVFDAMGFGALDAVTTPTIELNGEIRGSEELLKKIATLKKLISVKNFDRNPTPSLKKKDFQLIAIGSSTGGPKALSEILTKLPEGFDPAIVIIQHVDQRFASELCSWLDKQSPIRVRIAEEGDEPKRNTVFLASTNDHLVLNEKGKFHYTASPKDYPYRPSVDSFFQSLAANWHSKDIAVLLTGMGRDGAEGMLSLRKTGWLTIAQDEKTSVVYGMPKAAVDIGAAVQIISLDKIAANLISIISRNRKN